MRQLTLPVAGSCETRPAKLADAVLVIGVHVVVEHSNATLVPAGDHALATMR